MFKSIHLNKQFVIVIIFLISFLTNFSQKKETKVQDTAAVSKKVPTVNGVPQVDMIDYFVKIFKVKNSEEKRDDRRVRFSIFPTSSNISGGKTVFTSVNLAFLLGDRNNTNVSTIYFVPYLNTNQRYGFQIQPNIWTDQNKWYFTGEYFIMNYPQDTWGLGGNSADSNRTLIDYDYLRFHQNVSRRVVPNLFFGLGYSYDYHYNIRVEKTGWSDQYSDTVTFLNNSTSSGIVLPVLYGDRKNILNPQGGFMLNLNYTVFFPFLGSDAYWQSLFIDVRKYIPFNLIKQRILALRGYYWTVVSGSPPYLDYPSNRWEPISGSSSRGMAQNRYRSNALLYFESEYRFGFTKNGLFGGTIFASVISASQFNTQQFDYWHAAFGAGLRVKFNKFSRTNIALDVGFSKGYQAVYLNIGETF